MNFHKSNKKNYIFSSLFLIVLILIIVFFYKAESKEIILAKVGDKVITKKDFLLNYEFGLPHLKIGKTTLEKKKNYLQFMINEYLVSLEAQSKGLDSSPAIIYQSQKVKKELLLESIIENDVKPNVKISKNEIEETINKSKVSFKFFYWPEQDLENAVIIKEMFEEYGIEETFNKLSSKKSDFHFDISKYITDYLTWVDIPEETFAIIKNLPANKISDPVKIGDLYFIFQVQDIRRSTVTTSEYLSKSSTFYKILFNEKLEKEVIKYVDNLITPKNVITKINIFNAFAAVVSDWIRSEDKGTIIFSEWMNLHTEVASVQNFNRYQDSIFIEYNNGSFTLKEFQQYVDFDRISDEYETRTKFRQHLNGVLAISIRDYFLVNEAIIKGYDNSAWFKHEFMKWNSKFIFEEQLARYVTQNSSDSSKVVDKINSDLDLLKNKYEIFINTEMLDTLTVTESNKSKQTYIQLMKKGVERLAEPIVDGNWTSILK